MRQLSLALRSNFATASATPNSRPIRTFVEASYIEAPDKGGEHLVTHSFRTPVAPSSSHPTWGRWAPWHPPSRYLLPSFGLRSLGAEASHVVLSCLLSRMPTPLTTNPSDPPLTPLTRR